VQVKLLDTMRSGYCYYVEFYAANMQWVRYKTNNISACLTSFSLQTNLVAAGIIPNIQPHITNYDNPVLEDTVKWNKISGIYEAVGTEQYITIGNFKDNANTDTVKIYPVGWPNNFFMGAVSEIFIDAVSIYSINPTGALPWSYRDTTINKGDSVFIGNKMGGLNFHPQWFTENGTYIKTNAGITVSPTVTTKYVVQYTLCGVQRTDTVKVTVPGDDDVAIEKFQLLNEELKIYPNPADDVLNIECKSVKNNKKLVLIILNSLGEIIREEEIVFKENAARIKTIDLLNGVYFLQLKGKEGTASRKFLIGRP